MAPRHSVRLLNRSPIPAPNPVVLAPVSEHVPSSSVAEALDPDLVVPVNLAPTPAPVPVAVLTPVPASTPALVSTPISAPTPAAPVPTPGTNQTNPPPKPLPAIPPVDPLSSSDDSSSDDYPAPTPCPHTTMLSYATIVHSNVTRPSQMTDGTITPGVIQEFKQCTKCFFLNAKGGITEQQKVIRLLGCFANPLV